MTQFIECKKLSKFFALMILFTITSCSSSDVYIAPEFEDKVYTDVDLDVFYPKTRECWGTDSLSNAFYQQYYNQFLEFLPVGISLFSSFNRVNIILYEQEDKYLPTFNLQINAEKNEILHLPDSIKNLCAKSKSDFFLLFHNFGWSIEYKNKKNELDGFLTHFHLGYSLWDYNSGILISYGKKNLEINSRVIGSRWPYKSSMLKLAHEIFKNLPMFEK
jgi:hypothetical protein